MPENQNKSPIGRKKPDIIDIAFAAVCLIAVSFLLVGLWKSNGFTAKWNILKDSLFKYGGINRVKEGLANTLVISLIGLLLGSIIGTVIAIVKVIPPYKRLTRYLQKICNVYVAFFRGTPIVVQLLVGYYIIFPMLGINLPPVNVCSVIFGLNSGAYISEIMRGGINSVDAGQLEAGRALGLPFGAAMIKIVVPQAVKNILPTMGNEFIALIKETAVVGYVGATDICVAFRKLGTDTYEYMMPYLFMAVIYIVLVLVITFIIKLLEKRLRKSDRRS